MAMGAIGPGRHHFTVVPIHFSPLRCYVMECLKMKPTYSSTTNPCRKPRQKCTGDERPIPKLQEVKDEHCNCTSHTSKDHASPL